MHSSLLQLFFTDNQITKSHDDVADLCYVTGKTNGSMVVSIVTYLFVCGICGGVPLSVVQIQVG